MQRPARLIQQLANSAGFELTRFTPRNFERLRRAELLRSGVVDVLIDVGAAEGAWAAQAREQGFRGRIVSFEPRSEAFRALVAAAGTDGSWDCRHVALAASSGTAELNLAGTSSSLLPPSKLYDQSVPDAPMVGRESVTTSTLDDQDVVRPGETAFLKADVQGYELEVLTGGVGTLSRTFAVEIEVSFAVLYDDQPLAHEIIGWLAERGFRLVALEVNMRDAKTGDLLSANALFLRDGAVEHVARSAVTTTKKPVGAQT